MVRPLTKIKRDGTRTTRPADIEASIAEALGHDLETLKRRSLQRDSKQPGFLRSECLVHLIREARRRGGSSASHTSSRSPTRQIADCGIGLQTLPAFPHDPPTRIEQGALCRLHLDGESVGNLLCDAGTANTGVAAFELDDRVDEFLRWPFWAGAPTTSRREKPPIFVFLECLVEFQQGSGLQDDRKL